MVSSVSPETEHTPAKAMTVSRESPTAPVSDSSLLWRGRRARPRCPWAAAGPGCCARGRRGLAGLRDDAPSHTSATRRRRCGGCRRDRRARAGFDIDHSEPQARVWRSHGRPGPTAPRTPAKPQATSSIANSGCATGVEGAGGHWRARLWCGGTAAPGPRAPGSGCAPASAPLGHCPHHLGPRHAGRTRAHLGLSGAVEP